jgi:hypothetical protein
VHNKLKTRIGGRAGCSDTCSGYKCNIKIHGQLAALVSITAIWLSAAAFLTIKKPNVSGGKEEVVVAPKG